MNYIFVTGGVVSSLGKGIVAASIGKLLITRGIEVSVIKLDPYLNVDPGTMSPIQHGEVFVTMDGFETDLDLGHYERFMDVQLSKKSNVTAGQIYTEVLDKERSGFYLGGTIQTVPHVTDAIKSKIFELGESSNAEVILVEVGGTIGDIEGQPFIEAIRQLRNDPKTENVFYLHLTLLPYLSTSDEIKTKPTQHSIQALRGMGIQPDSIICRSEKDIEDSVKNKISLYCDVNPKSVISLRDFESVYDIPIHLEEQGLGNIIIDKLGYENKKPNLKKWKSLCSNITNSKDLLEIGVVGKYVELPDSYLSVNEAIKHAGANNKTKININWIDSDSLSQDNTHQYLDKMSGIIVPGGFGERGIDGMLEAARFCREYEIPYLGLCLGMQIMVIEYSKNILGLKDANSTEFDLETSNPVIDIIESQKGLQETGGTMRLGGYRCTLSPDSLARKIYGIDEIIERHRHRYEFNDFYKEKLNSSGFRTSGICPDNNLVEISEIENHPFMIGSQFHPEFGSRLDKPHPLFDSFISACLKQKKIGAQFKL